MPPICNKDCLHCTQADWAKLERVFPGITNDCVRLAGASKELKNGNDMYLRRNK